MLILLVGEGKMTLERAGEILGLEGREKAARWYMEHTLPRPEPGVEDPIETEEPAFLENLTQEDLDRLDRFLDIPPASGTLGRARSRPAGLRRVPLGRSLTSRRGRARRRCG